MAIRITTWPQLLAERAKAASEQTESDAEPEAKPKPKARKKPTKSA